MHEPTKQEELDRSRAKHMHTELVSQVFSSFRGISVSQGTNFVIAAVLGLVFARADRRLSNVHPRAQLILNPCQHAEWNPRMQARPPSRRRLR